MKDEIRLRIIGVTYNQIENGVYALILEDPDMLRRLAIVIGYPEAQSIECHLQRVRVPRPLSHDLMASIVEDLGAKVVRVDIHKLPSGPYAGKVTIMSTFGDIHVLDSRSSDAIALAIRTDAPIFTTKELLEKEGYIPDRREDKNKRKGIKEDKYLSEVELEELLVKYVNEENYEEAARIKRELDRRRGGED